MKRNRIFAVFAVAVLISSMAACDRKDEEYSIGSGGDDKVITFWNIATEDPDAALMQYAVDQYNEHESARSGYTIQTTSIPNDKYKEMLIVTMSSGECPDIYTSWSGEPLREYIDSGYAQPITDLYMEAGLDQIYMDAATAQVTFDDEIYGVPILNVSVSGIFYNTELFEQYNLVEPKTISELEAICDTLAIHGITPFALGNSTKWQGAMFYQELAARYGGLQDPWASYEESGSFTADSFLYAGNTILDWARRGYFQEGCNGISTDNGEDRQAMYQGKAAMLHSGSTYAAVFKADDADFYSKIGWFPMPECDTAPDGAEYMDICVGTVGDQFLSFHCTGEKLEEAMVFAKYYSSAECIQKMVEAGKIPPVDDVSELLSDPIVRKICAYVEQASDVQLWYDQYLPTSVSDVLLDQTQRLFAAETTAEEAANATQDAILRHLAEE